VDNFEEQAQLGPSLGQEAHRLDAIAHTLDNDCSLWRQDMTPWTVTPSLLPSQQPSWEVLCHVSRLDILLGARACGGEDGHLAHFDGRPLELRRRLLTRIHMAFGGLALPSPTPTTSYMCQNVIPQGDDVMF
jgi:hypothetical protein